MEHEAGRQGDGTDNQVFRFAEAGVSEAAAEGVGADAEQGETDGRHDAGRHDGRHKAAPPPRSQPQHPFEAAADEGCAQDGAVAVPGADDAERGHEGEADAHDDRQPAAQGTDGEQLQQGPDAGNDHGCLDQAADFRRTEFAHAADDQNRRDVGHEHGQDMLQAERNGLLHGNFSIQLVNGVLLRLHTLPPACFLTPGTRWCWSRHPFFR